MKTEVKITPAQEMVLYDSPEAAQFVTGISGWVNRQRYQIFMKNKLGMIPQRSMSILV
jgi:hypothetical protein